MLRSLWRSARNFLSGSHRPAPAGDATGVRAGFQERYHQFELLLGANGQALEAMARLEQARRSGEAFGVPFLRGNATEVSVGVARMIRALDALAPGRYAELSRRFGEIEGRLQALLAPAEVPASAPLVVPLAVVDSTLASQVGGKMASLGEAARLGARVPDGFVVTAQGYARFMAHNDLQAEINQLLQAAGAGHDYALELSTRIRQRVVAAEVPPDLAGAMQTAYAELARRRGPTLRVALRSSAIGEDAPGVSFAGQYRSVLNVADDYLLQAYKEVVASKYTLRAMLYRLSHGIRGEEVAMCVGCTEMLAARSGGVAYSRGPAEGDDAVVVSSTWGLPQAVVEGVGACDLFRLSRDTPPRLLDTHLAHKAERVTALAGEGVEHTPVPADLTDLPSLSPSEAEAVAALALRLEDHFGAPQDVEWALDEGGELHVLQCRPLHRAARTDAVVAVAVEPLARGGLTASPGAGSGVPFVVERNADLLRFPDGAVLVAAQAAPQWGALVGRAAAVVTETGTVTSHLASVAREFGVPALMGLAGAVGLLAGRGEVTVDASGGRVFAGRLPSLLTTRPAGLAPASETPVRRLLDRVLQLVSPLSLLDPDSPEFRAERCRTLHDVVRFAHEKAVQEMFAFARNQHVSERSSRQLVADVPMQLWVLDLADGLREGTKGRFVRIEDVVSVPMLALWRGMRAVPWEGPPPVDVRGFMSVMFQATANPELGVGTARTDFVQKNYFMVARGFCSLQSRFGFHFSSVEALVRERPAENYASFQFKGGAADLDRRLRRVAMVADLLRERGFRVETVEDRLSARLEGLDEAGMCRELEVLGFLVVHTRQLDMVMANEAAAAAAVEKLRAGMRALHAEGSSPVAGR